MGGAEGRAPIGLARLGPGRGPGGGDRGGCWRKVVGIRAPAAARAAPARTSPLGERATFGDAAGPARLGCWGSPRGGAAGRRRGRRMGSKHTPRGCAGPLPAEVRQGRAAVTLASGAGSLNLGKSGDGADATSGASAGRGAAPCLDGQTPGQPVGDWGKFVRSRVFGNATWNRVKHLE